MLIALVFLFSAPASFAQLADSAMWQTNGQVNDIHRTGDKVYIGGEFTYVGPHTGAGAVITGSTGALQTGFPEIEGGRINVSIADGNGGWYLGGAFKKVAGQNLDYLCHIMSDFSVDPNFLPAADSAVYTLALLNGTLYAGGSFRNIGGLTRNYIAAIDAATGQASSWNPNANAVVQAIAGYGRRIFVGGKFTNIGNRARPYLAKLDISSNTASNWNPGPDDEVKCLLTAGRKIFVGGGFALVGGDFHNNLASIDTGTGVCTPTFTGQPSSTVNCMVRSGRTLYIGGWFTAVSNVNHYNIAAIDTATGLAGSWSPARLRDPQYSTIINSIALSGTTLYVGGKFSLSGTTNAEARMYCTSFNTATGAETMLPGSADNEVFTMSTSGTRIFIGGGFTSVGGTPRSNLACLSAGTGKATSWYPLVNNKVMTVTSDGNTVYAGGFFTGIGTTTRNYIAALDPTDGTATSWNPNAGRYVYDLQYINARLYVAGDFTTIAGTSRSYLCALDPASGTVITAFNPNASYLTLCMIPDGNTLYVGGYFWDMNGTGRRGLAALNINTGAVLPNYNPDTYLGVAIAVGPVQDMVKIGNTIYAAGEFRFVGGQPRNYLAAVNATTGALRSWNPNADAMVYKLSARGNKLYAAGVFTNVGGRARAGFAELDTATGAASAWDLGAKPIGTTSLSANAILTGPDYIYVGGRFSSIAGRNRIGFAKIGPSDALSVLSFIPATGTFGTAVTITGVGFAGATAVSFGGVPATSFTVISDTEIRAVVSGGATGVVSVTSAGGTASSATVFTYCALSTPVITVTGARSFCEGGSVTLTSSATANNIWSTGATTRTITVTESGDYSVSVFSGPCLSQASTAVTVTVNPVPLVPTITAGSATTFCSGDAVRLTASSPEVLWSNGQTTQSIDVIASASVTVRGVSAGCTSAVSSPVVVTVNPLPARPTVTADAPLAFCAGNSVTLTSSSAAAYLWSNGAATRSITIGESGTYTVQTIANGCTSQPGTESIVTVTQNPAAPTITYTGSLRFCQGDSIQLSSSAPTGNIWSTGETSQSIWARIGGEYTVRAFNGSCSSSLSSIISVTVDPAPVPVITVSNGLLNICSDGNDSLTFNSSIFTASAFIWSHGVTTRDPSIRIGQSGTYTLRSVSANGCTSAASAPVTVNITITPNAPAITYNGSLRFCEGDSAELVSISPHNVIWTNGATTATTFVKTSGTYFVRAHIGQCTSIVSIGLVVVAVPRPQVPVIEASGALNICEGSTVRLSSSNAGATQYIWSTGEQTRSIVSAAAGTYSVRTINAAGCTSLSSEAVTVTLNPLPATPSVSNTGSLTLCAGDSVKLISSSPVGNLWSTGDTNATVVIRTPGSYTVRVQALVCTGASSAVVAVTMATPVAVPVISYNGLTLSAGVPAASYQWFLDGREIPGANGQTLVPASIGSYTVVVTDENNCRSQVSEPYLITGTYKAIGQAVLQLSPNPTGRYFRVTGLPGIHQADIYNMLGQKVQTAQSGTGLDIDLGLLPAGIYEVHIAGKSLRLVKNQ